MTQWYQSIGLTVMQWEMWTQGQCVCARWMPGPSLSFEAWSRNVDLVPGCDSTDPMMIISVTWWVLLQSKQTVYTHNIALFITTMIWVDSIFTDSKKVPLDKCLCVSDWLYHASQGRSAMGTWLVSITGRRWELWWCLTWRGPPRSTPCWSGRTTWTPRCAQTKAFPSNLSFCHFQRTPTTMYAKLQLRLGEG